VSWEIPAVAQLLLDKFIFYAGWVDGGGIHNNSDAMILANVAVEKIGLDTDGVVPIESGLLLLSKPITILSFVINSASAVP